VPVDGELFRAILGSFPSGVTVVTAMDRDGTPRGLTSNAVCAVSADPPLLLVCVSKASQTLPAIRSSGAFAVNFLAEGRHEVSHRFATKDPAKFESVAWHPSNVAGGAPVLAADSLAVAECVVTGAVEAGDHWIFVGRIDGGEIRDGVPLMYFRRRYGAWATGDVEGAGIPGLGEAVPAEDLDPGSRPELP